tara:strand:+ start:451 stop:663 length:213 start_codon:yes stop_codon:yes gene_type:complete
MCHCKCSSVFFESNELSLLSERSSRHIDAILSNKSLTAACDSAASGILSELSWMSSKLLFHTGVDVTVHF